MDEKDKVRLTEEEWRQRLTPDEYRVAREAGTERAFTGRYWNTKTPGTYLCAGCGQELFLSDTKYDSGTGWPSFWAPVEEGHVAARPEGDGRTEVRCSRCDAHLGHVFPDGPRPSGVRYCVNSASLRLREKE